MRLLLLLLFSSSAFGTAPNLSDIDVAAITKATVDFAHAAPLGLSEPTAPCKHTAEVGCTFEVQVTLSDGYLTVSKIDGVWSVGRWPLEIAAFQRCTAAVRAKWANADAQGLPADQKARTAEYRACYPPSGHFGGTP